MTVKNQIIKDTQIKKFCLYGFLKNCKFFEPYLLLFLLQQGMNLFQIGILIAVREVVANVFEIPSGIIADHYGRKKEMLLCFSFYIFSFIAFFFATTFAIAVIGMVFFGLGEAFRSGTHKAMIYTYLDINDWQSEKSFVYGRTRACSLTGSAVSSLLGVVFILLLPSASYIFLLSIIPYIADFFLLMTYPKALDKGDKVQSTTLKELVCDMVSSVKTSKNLLALLVEGGLADAIYSYMKDLIQPIMEYIILGSGVALIASLSLDTNVKIALGLVYALMNLVGAIFSKRSYLFKGERTATQCLLIYHVAMAVISGLLAITLQLPLLVCLLYILIYMFQNVRKPLYLEELDQHTNKAHRATILSTSSQLKSILFMVFAPLLGYLGDCYGIGAIMFVLSFCFLFSIPLLFNKPTKEKK